MLVVVSLCWWLTLLNLILLAVKVVLMNFTPLLRSADRKKEESHQHKFYEPLNHPLFF